MKRRISSVLVILGLPVLSFACDICGCGAGSGYIGFLPDFSKNVMGIRYRFNSLRTHIGAGGTITYLTTNEVYRTLELWGGWNIGKRLRIMASLPVNFNEQQNAGEIRKKTGLGDISFAGYYELLNKKKTVFTDKLFIQGLWIGGGVKLPTGEYSSADKPGTDNNTNLFQLGTGSVDFSANIMYDVRLQDAGINMNAGYKINTVNKYEYRYGNKLNLSAQAYYKFRIKDKFTIAPNAGVLYEKAKKDEEGGMKQDVSGGNVLLSTAGFEASFKNILLGGNFQSPLSQQLAGGFVKANDRWMLHVSFLF